MTIYLLIPLWLREREREREKIKRKTTTTTKKNRSGQCDLNLFLQLRGKTQVFGNSAFQMNV